MDYAEEAFVAKLHGDVVAFDKLSRQAFELEAEVARLVANTDVEPTCSVLHRSAASLAIDCKEYREAERPIATALSGNPPIEIAEELRDLLEQVNFNRGLALRGVQRYGSELQLTIAGQAVGLQWSLAKR